MNNLPAFQIITNLLLTESAKNSFTENVDCLTTALTLTIKVKSNLVTSSKAWDNVVMEINAILVMTLKFVQTSCDKNVIKENTALFDMFIKAVQILIWDFASMERPASLSTLFVNFVGTICTDFAKRAPNAQIITLKYLWKKIL